MCRQSDEPVNDMRKIPRLIRPRGFNRRGRLGFRRRMNRSPRFTRGTQSARRTHVYIPHLRGQIHTWINGGRQTRSSYANITTYTVTISNLSLETTSADLQEIFDEFDTLTNATLHYDRFGLSLGTGEAVFESEDEALEAIRKYDGLYLSETSPPMLLELSADLSTLTDLAIHYIKPQRHPPVRPIRRAIGGNRGNIQERGNNRGSVRGRRRGGRRGRNNN